MGNYGFECEGDRGAQLRPGTANMQFTTCVGDKRTDNS